MKSVAIIGAGITGLTAASFLRTREIAGHTAETMDTFLAGGGDPPLAASGGKAGLATGLFRPAVAERRKLSSKVALSLGKSNQGWSGETAGRLAVPG
jgi:glycine/D-amino acid oxidase-like deaminating enzyme